MLKAQLVNDSQTRIIDVYLYKQTHHVNTRSFHFLLFN